MKSLRTASLLIVSFLLCIPGNARKRSPSPHQIWVGSWAASQQIPEPRNSLPAEALQDATVRQIFHLSIGGNTLRLRLSNVFGTEPLHFASVHIARAVSPSSSAIVPGSDTPLTFSGAPDVAVPAGASYPSDPLPFGRARRTWRARTSTGLLYRLGVPTALDDRGLAASVNPNQTPTIPIETGTAKNLARRQKSEKCPPIKSRLGKPVANKRLTTLAEMHQAPADNLSRRRTHHVFK